MKKLAVVLTVFCSVSFSAPDTKVGTFVTGYDRDLNVVVTKNIQVWLNKSGGNEMRIEGEDLLEAKLEDGKLSAYVAKPKTYFYYSLELNPKTQPYGNQNLIVLSHGRNSSTSLVYSTSYCAEGTTALLTAYTGDGTKKSFCTTLK